MTNDWDFLSHAELISARNNFKRLGLGTDGIDREMLRRIDEAGGIPPIAVTIIDYGYIKEERSK